MAATNFTAGIAATYHLLEHPLTNLCGVLNCSTLLGFGIPEFLMFSGVPRKWDSWSGPRRKRHAGPGKGIAVPRRWTYPPWPIQRPKMLCQDDISQNSQNEPGTSCWKHTHMGCLLSQQQYCCRFWYEGDIPDHMIPISNFSPFRPLKHLRVCKNHSFTPCTFMH